MIEYPKIETPFNREADGGKKLVEGSFRSEAVKYLKDAEWVFTEKVDGGKAVDPTAVYAESRLYYDTRIRMVEEAADMACGFDGGPPARGIRPLLMAILDEYSYEEMIALYSISVVRCTREKWYTAYRRYFWFLDKLRM